MEVLVLMFIFFIKFSNSYDCIPRYFPDGIVCVCNSTYCDSISVKVPVKGKFRSYITTMDGKRFHTEDRDFENSEGNNIKLYLNLTNTYQTIIGFGGAFTDSAGLNIGLLNETTQENLLQSYFSNSGSKYSLGRIPIGGSDFSTRKYTLDDIPNDENLTKFSLTNEDKFNKIPFIKKALSINPQLKFFSAAWSAPSWMKSSGVLKSKYYQIYANYLVKFLETYKSHGIPIWAISTGNEPSLGTIPLTLINNMAWTPQTSAQWVVNNLGPAIENSNSNETIILALDDQRFVLPQWIDQMYDSNSNVEKYISGIAVHWYGDLYAPAEVFDVLHKDYPNKFLIMTEACTGYMPHQTKVRIGSWDRGEEFINAMIEDMNHWITGWVDWNLALNKGGGPSWPKNFVDSSIIVNPETDEFFKQPMYYAIGHFSKFVPRNSVRVELTGNDESVKFVAFKTPNNDVVIVLHNPINELISISIHVGDQGNINVHMQARSIRTIIYKQ